MRMAEQVTNSRTIEVPGTASILQAYVVTERAISTDLTANPYIYICGSERAIAAGGDDRDGCTVRKRIVDAVFKSGFDFLIRPGTNSGRGSQWGCRHTGPLGIPATWGPYKYRWAPGSVFYTSNHTKEC